MKIPTWSAFFLALVTLCAGADESLLNARRAQALLGAEVWSQVIRVENASRQSAYPRTVHALVFELAGILWFYTDADGTQSFSLHRGRLAEEKADFAPLLRDIDPGFTRWTVIPTDGTAPLTAAPETPVRNGCFIESYATLRMLVARGLEIAEPRLLSYYARSSARRQGHTVLAYSLPGGVAVVDPERPEATLHFPAALAADPARLARAVQGMPVETARMLPLPRPAGPAERGVFAAADPRRTDEVVR